eukprot:jgi/Chlat1/7785/Chrsp66S07253
MAPSLPPQQEQRVAQEVEKVLERSWKAGNVAAAWVVDTRGCLERLGSQLPSREVADLLINRFCHDLPASALLVSYLQHALGTGLVSGLYVFSILPERVLPLRKQKPQLYEAFLVMAAAFAPRLSPEADAADLTRVTAGEAAMLVDHDASMKCSFDDSSCNSVTAVLLKLTAQIVSATSEDWRELKEFRTPDDADLASHNTMRAAALIAAIMLKPKSARLLWIASRSCPQEWQEFEEKIRNLQALPSFQSRPLSPLMAAIERVNTAIRNLFGNQLWRELPSVQLLATTKDRSLTKGSLGSVQTSVSAMLSEVLVERLVLDTRQWMVPAAQQLAKEIVTTKMVTGDSWQQVIASLWIAALRMVQRGKLGAGSLELRLTVLLNTIPAALVGLLHQQLPQQDQAFSIQQATSQEDITKLVSDVLPQLAAFPTLLSPPAAVLAACTQARALSTGQPQYSTAFNTDATNADGDLLDLLIGTCKESGLVPSTLQRSQRLSKVMEQQGLPEKPPASVLVMGVDVAKVPAAGSLRDLQTAYTDALAVSNEGVTQAACVCNTVLREYQFQAEAIQLLLQLLRPEPSSTDASYPGCHLLEHSVRLFAVMTTLACGNFLEIINLHGQLPQLAAALVPICDVFGGCPTTIHSHAASASMPGSSTLLHNKFTRCQPPSNAGHVRAEAIFSSALLLLMRMLEVFAPPGNSPSHRMSSDAHVEDDLWDVVTKRWWGTCRLYAAMLFGLMAHWPETEMGVPTDARGPYAAKESLHEVDYTISSGLGCFRQWISAYRAGALAPAIASPASQRAQAMVDLVLAVLFEKHVPGAADQLQALRINAASTVQSSWEILLIAPAVVREALMACAGSRIGPSALLTGLSQFIAHTPAVAMAVTAFLCTEAHAGDWLTIPLSNTDFPSAIPPSDWQAMQTLIATAASSGGLFNDSQLADPTPAFSTTSVISFPCATLLSVLARLPPHLVPQIYTTVAPLIMRMASFSPPPMLPIASARLAGSDAHPRAMMAFEAAALSCGSCMSLMRQAVRRCFAPAYIARWHDSVLRETPWMLLSRVFAVYPESRSHPALMQIVVSSVQDLANEPHSIVPGADSAKQLAAMASGPVKAGMLAGALLHLDCGAAFPDQLLNQLIPLILKQTTESGLAATLVGYSLSLLAATATAVSMGATKSDDVDMSCQLLLAKHWRFIAGLLQNSRSDVDRQMASESYAIGFVTIAAVRLPAWLQHIPADALTQLVKALQARKLLELALAMFDYSTPKGGAAAAALVCSQVEQVGAA